MRVPYASPQHATGYARAIINYLTLPYLTSTRTVGYLKVRSSCFTGLLRLLTASFHEREVTFLCPKNDY